MYKQVDAEYSFQSTNEECGIKNTQGNFYTNIELRFDVEGNSLKIVQLEILLGGTRIMAYNLRKIALTESFSNLIHQ